MRLRTAADIVLALSAVALFLFFGTAVPYHLVFQEAFQMFLFTGDYFAETAAVPGGMSDYISGFLIQFFISPWAGAAIMACTICTVQFLVWKASKCGRGWFLPLTYIPAFILTAFHCDEMAMLSADISIIAALCLTLILERIHDRRRLMVTGTVMIPVMFFAFGTISLLFIFPLIRRIRRFALWSIPSAVLCPVSAWYITHLPPGGLYGGLHFYRTFDFPVMPWTAAVSAFVIIMTGLICTGRRVRPGSHPAGVMATAVLTCAAGWIMLTSSLRNHNCAQRELTCKYAFLLMDEKWDTILSEYEKDGSPSTLFPTAAHNMALALKGRLAEEMFRYPQHGTQSLIPKYKLDYFMPLFLSGIHFELGFVNQAQRYAFESLQSIPFFQKSSRCYRMLAVTNMMNGEESVAVKYLEVLKHTLFYRRQACQDISDIKGSPSVMAGRKSGTEDKHLKHLLFDEDSIPACLSALCGKDEGNSPALQYLLCYIMLQGDMNSFREHFDEYYHLPGNIPGHYAEALLVGWTARNRDCSDIPWNISEDKCTQCMAFRKDIMSRKPKGELRKQYGDTYWYYLLFNNRKK